MRWCLGRRRGGFVVKERENQDEIRGFIVKLDRISESKAVNAR